MDKEVVLSTGDIKRDYEIVKIIAAAQTVRSWIVESGGREVKKFMDELNKKLKEEAINEGCDGVIWIDYDFTKEKGKGALGSRTTLIITAYGTGVKFK